MRKGAFQAYANSKDPDQQVMMHNLIRAIAIPQSVLWYPVFLELFHPRVSQVGSPTVTFRLVH